MCTLCSSCLWDILVMWSSQKQKNKKAHANSFVHMYQMTHTTTQAAPTHTYRKTHTLTIVFQALLYPRAVHFSGAKHSWSLWDKHTHTHMWHRLRRNRMLETIQWHCSDKLQNLGVTEWIFYLILSTGFSIISVADISCHFCTFPSSRASTVSKIY